MQKRGLVGLSTLLILCLAATAPAQTDGEISCEMQFTLSGWSIFYKTADGHGTVTCGNGQSMHVKLEARGGGVTFGTTEITDGHATFSGVFDIKNVLGHYGMADAHAGVAEHSAKAQVMTKGNVSIAMVGKGEGWNLGIAFGDFEILAD